MMLIHDAIDITYKFPVGSELYSNGTTKIQISTATQAQRWLACKTRDLSSESCV